MMIETTAADASSAAETEACKPGAHLDLFPNLGWQGREILRDRDVMLPSPLEMELDFESRCGSRAADS